MFSLPPHFKTSFRKLHRFVCLCVYVYMYIECMYVCMHACTCVSMYATAHVWKSEDNLRELVLSPCGQAWYKSLYGLSHLASPSSFKKDFHYGNLSRTKEENHPSFPQKKTNKKPQGQLINKERDVNIMLITAHPG